MEPALNRPGETMEGNMRQAVLGSTALPLFGLAAADAAAADGVKLSIGGRYHATAGRVVGEDFSASFNASTTTSRSASPMRLAPASPWTLCLNIPAIRATTPPARTIKASD